jgi:YNFM family putative membrane transporter
LHGVDFSREPYNLSSSVIGMLFFAYLAGTLGSVVSGRLSDKLGKSSCIMTGIAIISLGSLLTLISYLPVILLGLVLQCFGTFFAHSASASWVNARATFAKASAASLYLFFYDLGWFWQHYLVARGGGGSMLVFVFTFLLSRKLYAIGKLYLMIETL